MDAFVKSFGDIGIADIPEVGGKNASLGEMFNRLTSKGIQIPDGFAVTCTGFRHFIGFNGLDGIHSGILSTLNKTDYSNLREIGRKCRDLILSARMPGDLSESILSAYSKLDASSVAVRSSATAGDLPSASFAGQHESFLNISGEEAVLEAVKQCFASLYTDRAIKYREDNRFDHSKVYLSVGIQKMVRADLACSGIGFTLDPDSGFRNVVHVAGVWGLGETIVQGQVTPDEFTLFKPSLEAGKKAILERKIGNKTKMMIYAQNSSKPTLTVDTPASQVDILVLSDEEVTTLGNWGLEIEKHYQKPMDFEWAKDGYTNQLFIIQARPETVYSRQRVAEIKEYKLVEKAEVLVSGEAIGNKIVSGTVRILKSPEESDKLLEGEILVTEITSPDWDPILKRVGAIITNKGGRTSHASIVARELGVPAIVGTESGTIRIKDGDQVTVSCAEGKIGRVYQGLLKWNEVNHDLSSITLPDKPEIKLIVGEPDRAFQLTPYPNHGVGLMRLEFIISDYIRIHPMAFVKFNDVKDEHDRSSIENLTRAYPEKKRYFIEKLAEGVSTIAAAFYPKEVIVRMSDFKTNEYANLIGGKVFEPEEENPMIGFRGASRYYNDLYKEGFGLECEAMKLVRDEMGLSNVKLMIPFCRTPEEGRKVIDLMNHYGLKQGENGLEIFVMAEIPSNVILAEEFANVFDGFSIGSNDLTQLTLGIDRDSSILRNLFDEENAASKAMIKMMIEKARLRNKEIGICGQAPSDSPNFVEFLINSGINSISFNPDALIAVIKIINKLVPMHPEIPEEIANVFNSNKTDIRKISTGGYSRETPPN